MDEITKTIIRDMQASGLRRNEFRVRRNRVWRKGHTADGCRRYEYDGYSICLFCTTDRMWEVASELAKRFEVTRLILDGEPRRILVQYSGQVGMKDWRV